MDIVLSPWLNTEIELTKSTAGGTGRGEDKVILMRLQTPEINGSNADRGSLKFTRHANTTNEHVVITRDENTPTVMKDNCSRISDL